MSARKTYRSNALVGKYRNTHCDGSISEGNSTQNHGSSVLGFWKSNIIKSDRLKPTNYSIYFINSAIPGHFDYEAPAFTCYRPDGSVYSTTTAFSLPFMPNYYNFACLGGMLNFVSSNSSTSLTSTATLIQRQLENAVLKKLKDQKVNVLVTLGESKESLKTAVQLTKIISATLLTVARGIISPTSLIVQAKALHQKYWKTKNIGVPKKNWILRRYHNAMYDAFRRGKYREADLLDNTTNSWLAYRYGILPLMGDVQAYHDLIYQDQLKNFYTGLSSVRHRYRNSFPINGLGDNVGSIKIQGNSKVDAQVKLFYKIKATRSMQMSKLAMSLRDVPSALYELIPFSFVYDWFHDVGSYLELLGASYGLEFHYGYFSIKEVVEAEGLWTGTVLGASTQPKPIERSDQVYGHFRRNTYLNFPTPNIPPFESPFSGLLDKRLLDSISLTSQLLRDKKLRVPRQSIF